MRIFQFYDIMSERESEQTELVPDERRMTAAASGGGIREGEILWRQMQVSF